MKLRTFASGVARLLSRLALATLCVVGPSALADRAAAHEVDQYTLPKDKQFVDLGGYWDKLFYDAVKQAVDDTNFKLEQVKELPRGGLRDSLLDHYHSQDTLAWTVWSKLPTAFMAIEGLEMSLRWKNLVEPSPGKIHGYLAPISECVYTYVPSLPDPRQLNRMSIMRCSLIKVHGTYMGTDKIGHFISMGFWNYANYRLKVSGGDGSRKAMRGTVLMARKGMIGESGLFGNIPTGIYSNADQASNYVGMKYFQNLMEPVKLKGQTCPPMVVVEHGMLKLQPHVRPAYFARFVSNHFDEVLNPCLYECGMRDDMRAAIKERRKGILDWYAGNDPQKRNRAYFDRLVTEYSTYYGEDYGYSGAAENLITVGNTCFADRAEKLCRTAPTPMPARSANSAATSSVAFRSSVPTEPAGAFCVVSDQTPVTRRSERSSRRTSATENQFR